MNKRMYSIKENIFIVWGGNHPLAERLEKRLGSKKLRAQVGGSAESQNSNYYLGPRILEQMNKATHAIILAKPEIIEENDKKKFRENLMFEWGYLLGRLAPQNIFVYLIDCQRADLPSDLHGAYTQVVNGTNDTDAHSDPKRRKLDTAHAKIICDDFVRSSKNWEGPTAFGVLADWPEWRRFIVDQLENRAPPQPYRLRKALRYAFIPASYFGTRISELRQMLSKIEVVGEHDVQDIVAVKGILDYLELARRAGDRKQGDFDAIKRSFSYVANSQDPEVTLMARYAMGLCLLAESFHHVYTNDKRRELLSFAHENFCTAHELLTATIDWRKMGIRKLAIDSESKFLWESFLTSNIGKCLALLGKEEMSVDYYKISLDNRDRIQQQLSIKGNKKIHSLFTAEAHIHRLRLMNVSNSLDHVRLDDIEADFKTHKPDIPHQYKVLEREIEKSKDFLAGGERFL